MNFHIRFLATKIALFTAIAGMLNPLSPEWNEVYKNRLICEVQMNLLEAEDEQATGEEVSVEGSSRTEVDVPRVSEVRSESTAPETDHKSNQGTGQVEIRPDAVSMVAEGAPLYQIDGDVLDPGIAGYLYRRLCEANIGWFYEYAVCLAYQESSFNPLAENVNGRDKGLFQYRVEFHPGLDWTNPYQQVDLFTAQMAARSAAGCDVYSMISRHNTSDWAPELNPVYINQVMSHFPALQRIR